MQASFLKEETHERRPKIQTTVEANYKGSEEDDTLSRRWLRQYGNNL